MNKKISILYVDDEFLNLMLFTNIFSRKFNIITTDSGIKGLEILHSNPDIGVVISDMKMPVMNGIEFIEQAKKVFPTIAYFILTGYNMTEEISNALKNKLILKYLCKPFNVKEIEESIVEALNS